MRLLAAVVISIPVLFCKEERKKPELFFTEGCKITYQINGYPLNGKPRHNTSVLLISKTERKGASCFTEALLTYLTDDNKPGNVFRMRYACDSLNFYVHTANWSYERVGAEYDDSYSLTGDSIIYPFDMKVGDTLKPAHFVKKYSGGVTRYISAATYYHRKVVSYDTIPTSFGKQPAFQISMDVSYTNESTGDIEGRDREKDDFEIVEWFVPSLGVVRTEYKGTNFGKNIIFMDKYENP